MTKLARSIGPARIHGKRRGSSKAALSLARLMRSYSKIREVTDEGTLTDKGKLE